LRASKKNNLDVKSYQPNKEEGDTLESRSMRKRTAMNAKLEARIDPIEPDVDIEAALLRPKTKKNLTLTLTIKTPKNRMRRITNNQSLPTNSKFQLIIFKSMLKQ